jgi:Lipopolysaccharide-assembly
MRHIWFSIMLVCSALITGCGVYSFTGGQFGEAKTFSVSYLKPQTGLATPLYAQRLTESLKDVMLSQSPLKWQEENGDLQFSGKVTNYTTAPVAINAGATETAALNRLSITVDIHYENTLEPALSFDRSFTKYADFNANQDLFSIEESLWKLINDQLTQEVYNASVGNW